ncbi:hypothetical protein Avbf_16335 [Armadillidium vulgare]|nr:hypothetical protein Avbf_16335 [Armadillidium vulgare]
MKVTICQRKNILKSKQWQKFNRQPWELVEQIWKETSANRILVIHQKDESTISSTLFDWPILQHANGYILNFYDTFTTQEYGFFGFNIPVYFHRRRCYAFVFTTIAAKTKKKKIALLLKKNTFWKPYKRDMQEAFVIHVQNPKDVPSHYIQENKRNFTQNVFEHATICNFAEKRPEYSSDYYVVLKDILYGFDSPLKAVENCL